jgi:hypothetical protein
MREARAPKRMIPPPATATTGTAGYIGYVLEGVSLLSRAPALAVMEYLPGELI